MSTPNASSSSTPARPRPPRPKVMSLTDAAAERVREIMASSDKPIIGIKVGVKNGGCAGMEYTMGYAEQAEKFDEVVEDKGVKILIDPKAILFLLGTEMDYKIEKLKAGFVFNNPNQTSACGCGKSVAITPRKPDEATPTAADRRSDCGRRLMSISDSFRELLLEQLAPLGPVRIRRMFGGGGVFVDGLMFGLVQDDRLFLKADASNRGHVRSRGHGAVRLSQQG